MNAISHSSRKGALRIALLPVAVVLAYGQNTQINLATQGKNVDFTSAPFTRPVKTGTALPGTCSPGDLFFKTDAAAGQNLYACTAVNTWVPQATSAPAGLGDPGSNGIVLRTGVNTTSAVSAPAGAIVGTSAAQTLSNKSIDASEITTGTLSAARLPAFSGDISTAAGSSVTTLAAVNSSPGAYGDSTHAVQITVDGKGRITAVSQVGISGGGGAIASGTLASRPSTCTVGALYAVTDGSSGRVLSYCQATNTWETLGSIDGSGLTYNGSGDLGLDLTKVPLLASNNHFTGNQTVDGVLTVGSCVGCGGSFNSVTANQSTGTVVPGSLVETILLFDTNLNITNGSMHSTSSNTGNFVVPTTGYWAGVCNIVTNGTSTNNLYAVVRVNGAAPAIAESPKNTGVASVSIPYYGKMTAGDVVTCSAGGAASFTTSNTTLDGKTNMSLYQVH